MTNFKTFTLSALFLGLLPSFSQAQVELNPFSSGEVILKEKINENYSRINNYLQNYFGESISFTSLTSKKISSQEFNSSIEALNQKFSATLPSIPPGTLFSATLLENYFASIANTVNQKISFADCFAVLSQTTGIKTLDSDGILGPLAPSIQYCNYLYGAAHINNFRIRSHSRDYERDSTNYVILNNTYVSQNHGRGWGITILDKNLNKVFRQGYDTYGGVGNTNNLINFLNTASYKQALVIFTTSDEPRLNGAANANLRTAIENYSGCSAASISTIPERGAYVCVAMRNSLNQKSVIFQQVGVDTATSDNYINFLNYYNFVNK